MEITFKIVFSFIIAALFGLTLRWLWTTQIDVPESFSRIFSDKTAPPSWVATREPDKIYQNGKIVGEVQGVVTEKDGLVFFETIANVTTLDKALEFEYQRSKLKIISVDTIIGTQHQLSGSGFTQLHNVHKNVKCKIIK